MELLLFRSPGGSLIPADDESAEWIATRKAGVTLRAEITQFRNYKFHKKWFALAKLAFDMWAETQPKGQEYKGIEVLPDFDRFRRDLIIMAGFYRPVFNARGELRLEADSLKWSQMDEDRFAKLYSATINVILQKILPGRGLTEESLQNWIDRVMDFA